MPRGIPGSGKAALKKAGATQQGPPATTAAPSPVKKTWSRKPKAAAAATTSSAGGERSYSLMEKFAAAQGYLASLLGLAMRNDMSSTPSPTEQALQREILATVDTLSALRQQLFGVVSPPPTPDVRAVEATPEQRTVDERIRQHVPAPTGHQLHVSPPPSTSGNAGQQAPFLPTTPTN